MTAGAQVLFWTAMPWGWGGGVGGRVLSIFAHTCLRGQNWRNVAPVESVGAPFCFALFLFLSVLLACVCLFFADTGLALDVATPPYLAVAGQCDEA